ncbi:M15 family metallopeptidase [Legionella nagasakiensis]|uniref:M15 family metallopeptidase n=1 Tax=Legionella nagasakiensis TaxID=535290 RepID=UPI0010564334|nr:M15 family metallopeptidase [Legionella nagasakiensis]
MTIKHQLIDIIKYSREQCTLPIQVTLKYATSDNFIGRVIDGYHTNAAHLGLLTRKPLQQLCAVQEHLLTNYGCTLLVYDAYRPLRAVKYMVKWCEQAEADEIDLLTKMKYFPAIEKKQLLDLGYLAAEVSSHCYANTVDVVLADMVTGEPLDMGSAFDCFDPISHTNADIQTIGADAHRHRYILKLVMERFGFISYEKEYWHFECSEKEIDTPLDLPIN